MKIILVVNYSIQQVELDVPLLDFLEDYLGRRPEQVFINGKPGTEVKSGDLVFVTDAKFNEEVAMWLLIERHEDYEDYFVLLGIYNSVAEAICSVDNYEEDRNLAVSKVQFGEVDLEELAQPELDRKHAKYLSQLQEKEQEGLKALLSSHSGHVIQEINGRTVCQTCVKVFAWSWDHYEERFIQTFVGIKRENDREKAEQEEILKSYKEKLAWLKETYPESGLIPIIESLIAERENV